MEIALATNGLVGIGGSETYLLTVAEHLRRLGHGVVVHAEEGGAMSELMEARGLRVEIGERGLPETCDAILVQDATMAYALADRWPEAPQVFRAPSALYDFQSPPQLPGVVAAVVVCSDRMARHVEAMAGEREIVRLRQPIDIKRLCPRGEIRERPRRALLLGNYVAGRRRELIAEAWGEAGVECVSIGAHGSTAPDPAAEIAAADIVVGKARAILDAMACGRAAYVLDVAGGDGWVTEERYAAMEADNFAGQATEWSLDRDRLVADLAGYRPAMGQVNRDLVLAHHDAADAHPGARRAVPPARPAGGGARRAAARARAPRPPAVGGGAGRDRAAPGAARRAGPRGRRRGLRGQPGGGAPAALRGDRAPPRRGGAARARAPVAGAMSGLVASDRGPGLLLGPGVELPDDVLLGGHVVIYGGTRIEPGCRIQDGAVHRQAAAREPDRALRGGRRRVGDRARARRRRRLQGGDRRRRPARPGRGGRRPHADPRARRARGRRRRRLGLGHRPRMPDRRAARA